MKPGELIELHTPNAVVAVRGTVLVVEIVPPVSGAQPASSPDAITTRVYLLHGSVDVSLRNDPTAAPVHLKSLQGVEVSRNTLGTVRSLSPEAVAAATSGLTANELSRPGPPAAFLSALLAQQLTLVGHQSTPDPRPCQWPWAQRCYGSGSRQGDPLRSRRGQPSSN
jgi:hypothetical protein